MKFKFQKEVKGGDYYVKIALVEILPAEKEKIIKFGAPLVSLEPQRYFDGRRHFREFPLHEFGHDFKFDNEEAANKFVSEMTNRIKSAVDTLNSMKDNFSKEEEHEF